MPSFRVQPMNRSDDAVDRVDGHGRPHPPERGGEAETLLGFLDYQRATLAWRVSGLDAESLAVTVASSAVTLGGLLAHMVFVEEYWCTYWLRGGELGLQWQSVDWDQDPDADWHSAATRPPEVLLLEWERAVETARRNVEEALAQGGLDAPTLRVGDQGEAPSLRWVLVHLIEEYARHNGHADFLREAIDGQVGE